MYPDYFFSCDYGTTKSTNIFYIGIRITCTIKVNIKENFKIWILSFLVRSKYLTSNDHFFDKVKTYLNQELQILMETLEENIFKEIYTEKR